jgi:hypothetical protein
VPGAHRTSTGTEVHLLLHETDDGWDVVSANGVVTLAEFRGHRARSRALSYIERHAR